MKKIDLIGQRFGEWLILGQQPSQKKETMWQCLCSCGEVRTVSSKNLRLKKSQSCGHERYTVQTQIAPNRSAIPVHHRKKTAGYAVFYDYFNTARERKLEFALTEEEFYGLAAQPCAYCGRAPYRTRISKYGDTFIYNGVDRVDNTKGYIRDNCVSCCKWCNFAKNNSHVDDFIASCRAVAQYQNQKLLAASLPKIAGL